MRRAKFLFYKFYSSTILNLLAYKFPNWTYDNALTGSLESEGRWFNESNPHSLAYLFVALDNNVLPDMNRRGLTLTNIGRLIGWVIGKL